jgi:Terminase large subunit, T4likevirus-type, N-terminal
MSRGKKKGGADNALAELAEALVVLADSAEADHLKWVDWTPPQEDWLRMHASRKLLRAGNQVGKTWAGLAEVIWRALGKHPHYPVRPPPIEAWIICVSWSQSVAVMKKFWALVPKDQLIEGTKFDRRRGFGKENPAVVFKNNSIVRFKTAGQDEEALASASIDYVHIDEPCDPEVYRELDRRVLRRGGSIGITLTPINRPCEWLHDLVEMGSIKEVHARMEPRTFLPKGWDRPLCIDDGTPMDAAWIQEQRRITPKTYAGVVLDGDWETRPEGAFFAHIFDKTKHVTDKLKLDPARGKIRWVLGIDYAAADRELGQIGVLCQVQSRVDEKNRPYELIIAWDLVALGGATTSEAFARALIDMLERNGLSWHNLTSVYGDNPVVSRWVEKSNIHTMRALATELGVSFDGLKPRVLNAKDGQTSVGTMDAGCRYLYEGLASGRILIHPRCKVLIEGLETWDYTKLHPRKDVIDGWRYALRDFIFKYPKRSIAPVVHVR